MEPEDDDVPVALEGAVCIMLALLSAVVFFLTAKVVIFLCILLGVPS